MGEVGVLGASYTILEPRHPERDDETGNSKTNRSPIVPDVIERQNLVIAGALSLSWFPV